MTKINGNNTQGLSDDRKPSGEIQAGAGPSYRLLCNNAAQLDDADLEKLLGVAPALFAEAFDSDRKE